MPRVVYVATRQRVLPTSCAARAVHCIMFRERRTTVRSKKVGVVVSGALVLVVFASLLVGSYRASANSCDAIACWQVSTSPNVGSGDNILNSVKGISSTQVWTVGYYINSSQVARTLIQLWKGSSWSTVTSPNSGSSSYLNSVGFATADTNATDVWAVGYYTTTTSAGQTLIEKYHSSSWSVVSSPNQSGANYLNSVDGSSATNYWAVGNYVSNGVNKTLVMSTTNGTSWSLVSSPNASSGNGVLNSVAVLASDNVWAAGSYTDTNGIYGLILHWNGVAWTKTELNSFHLSLQGVSFISQSDGWAVGYYPDSYGTPIAYHYYNGSWARDLTAGTVAGFFYAVHYFGLNSAIAVGKQTVFASPDRAHGERWNGTSWSDDNLVSPNHNDRLYGVSAVSGTDIWAVGFTKVDDSHPAQTLIEHYN